jgi:replicative DNA helicase
MATAEQLTVPPHNIEAEKSVLGAVLLDERHLNGLLVEEQLRAEHFYREQYGAVFAAMQELFENDRKIDHLTVAETLRQRGKLAEIGGPEAIDELAGWVPAAGHAREYGRIVREKAQMRALLTSTLEIQSSVYAGDVAPQELLERAERSMLEVAHGDQQRQLRTIADILDEETERLHRLSIAKSPLTGTPSGFKDLDERTGGFQPGNLIVIAARPSMGKSALVANIAENAALGAGDPDGRPYAVVLFSLEMSESELAQRFVASQANIPGEDLRRGRVAEQKWPKILEACGRLSQAPLYIDDSSDTGVLEVRAKARRLHHKLEGGLGLIIVDYLQLMRHEGRVENRVEQVGQISRGLKGLARELGVPVIALSQLSRAVEQRGGDKRPILSDLRECVTGETPVLLADGQRVPIGELVGTTPEVLALDERRRIVRARSDAVWPVGRRKVFRLKLASGRYLRATADHRVLCGSGWRRLSEIAEGDRVALARRLPTSSHERWPDERVVNGIVATSNTNVDTLPTDIWGIVRAAMAKRGITQRAMASMRGTSYGGAAHFGFAPSRATIAQYAELLDSPELAAESDVFWDRVVSIDPDGEEDVFDVTVPGPSCWLADGIVTHNSGQIEQDSDLVMFIYREEYYLKDESERPGEADIIIAKHRNGPVGDIVLTFRNQYPKFMNYAGERFTA